MPNAIFILFPLLLFATIALAVLGGAILVLPNRAKPQVCVRRRCMVWMGCAGFLIGGVYWMWEGWQLRGMSSVLGSHIGGLVFGAVLGNLVGRAVWLRLKVAEREVDS